VATTTNTDGHIEGRLEGTDYGDNVTRDVADGDVSYSLTADGRGKLAFKVEMEELDPTRWVKIEEKQKIEDTTVHGSFTVIGQTDDDPPTARIRFNFNREFLARAVDYDLRW